MVGTAHAHVTGSCATKRANGSAWRNRPGIRRSAPASHACVRRAPRVGVEHRDDRQDAVVGVVRDHRAVPRRHRVQVGGAVRVDDTLRVAGGAARVAHRGRGPLVDLGVLEAGRVAGGEQLVVAQHGGAGGRIGRARTTSPSPTTTYASTVVSSAATAASSGHEVVVDDDHAVFGVVHDVRELLGEQPQVQRVEHRADARGWRSTPPCAPGCST